MNLSLRVWRQKNASTPGQFVEYRATDVSPDMSFLEMLDVVNEGLIARGEEPIAFDHDCREGICGTCGLMINGVAHGPLGATTTCQLHMRFFKDGDTIVIEPWRARPFPVIKDLIVDRSAFDRIIQSGGFIAVNTGGAPDANAIPVPKVAADLSMDAASCIACGACVAACKNASAMLFVSAKIGHLNTLPQGEVEKDRRVLNMVRQMDEEGFGNCSVLGSCEAVCPKEISLDFISKMNREYAKALLRTKDVAPTRKTGGVPTVKRRDDRDLKKSDDAVIRDETDESMQAGAELQVDKDRERENLNRFAPDPQAEPPGEQEDTRP